MKPPLSNAAYEENRPQSWRRRALRAAFDRPLRLLSLFAAILVLTGLGRLDLWAPDEPRYGAIAEEIRAGEHGIAGAILLRSNGVPYTQKPPLYFWLAALAGTPGGRVDELAARLPSALSGIGCILLTFWIAKRLLRDSTLGLIAAALLVTSFRFLWTARRAQLDVLLTLCELAAIALFVAHGFRSRDASTPQPGPAPGQIACLHLMLGLGALTKGPVAWLPLVVALVYFAWEGRIGLFRAFVPAWAWLLSLGPLAVWALAAFALAPPGFAEAAIGENLIERFFSGTSHVRPFYYFLYQTPADFLPWSPLLVVGLGSLAPALRHAATQREPSMDPVDPSGCTLSERLDRRSAALSSRFPRASAVSTCCRSFPRWRSRRAWARPGCWAGESANGSCHDAPR